MTAGCDWLRWRFITIWEWSIFNKVWWCASFRKKYFKLRPFGGTLWCPLVAYNRSVKQGGFSNKAVFEAWPNRKTDRLERFFPFEQRAQRQHILEKNKAITSLQRRRWSTCKFLPCLEAQQIPTQGAHSPCSWEGVVGPHYWADAKALAAVMVASRQISVETQLCLDTSKRKSKRVKIPPQGRNGKWETPQDGSQTGVSQ